MSITVVNDWRFKPDGDVAKGMQAAKEYVAYLNENEPELELSLWTRHDKDPKRFFHITVFGSEEAVKRQYESEGTKRFAEALFPEIIRDDSFTAPWTHVVLSSGADLKPLDLKV